MTELPEPERLNQEGFTAFAGRASPEYQSVGHLHTEALTEGALHPIDPGQELP